MITIDKIELFERHIKAGLYAFGSPTQEATIPDIDKDMYWSIYQDLLESFQDVLDAKGLNNKFYIKPTTPFSRDRGIRGHRPKDLWCAIRNINSKAFNEMPQIYAIVSNRGFEIGFAVSITEKDYSDSNVKMQNREIIPMIHNKLPIEGNTIDNLDKLVTLDQKWHVNEVSRLVETDKGFDKYDRPSELFKELKKQEICYGGGSICKIISPDHIIDNPVDIKNEIENSLNIFSEILTMCSPSEPDRKIRNIQKQINDYSEEEFQIDNVDQAREKTLRSISSRRGQGKFRNNILEIYESECVITNCKIPDVLQAAHIFPYNGKETNKPDNGLLLRTDIHDLFDMFLISIEPESLIIKISPKLFNSSYDKYNNKKMKIPSGKILRPSSKALTWHYNKFTEML